MPVPGARRRAGGAARALSVVLTRGCSSPALPSPPPRGKPDPSPEHPRAVQPQQGPWPGSLCRTRRWGSCPAPWQRWDRLHRWPGCPSPSPGHPRHRRLSPAPLRPRPSLPPHPCPSSPVPGSPLQAEGPGKLPCLCLGAFMSRRGGGGRSARAGTPRLGQREAAFPCKCTDCTDYIMESCLRFSLRVSSWRKGGSEERWQIATGLSFGVATPGPLGKRAAAGKWAKELPPRGTHAWGMHRRDSLPGEPTTVFPCFSPSKDLCVLF